MIDRDIKPANNRAGNERVPWLGLRSNRRRTEEEEIADFEYQHDEGQLSYQRGRR